MHEKKRVGGRGLTEDEEDHKAALWYDLEKEMKQIFKQFPKVLKSSTVIFDCALKIWETERKFEKAGLSLEEIQEVRKGIVDAK